MNYYGIIFQSHQNRLARNEAPRSAGACPVIAVPTAYELLIWEAVVPIPAVAVVKRIGGIVRHHAVARQRQRHVAVPFRGVCVALEDAGHAKYRRQMPVGTGRSVPSLLSEIDHCIALKQPGCELFSSAEAGDRGIGVLEVGLAPDRPINEWPQPMAHNRIAASLGSSQRSVCVQKKSPLMIAHDCHYGRRCKLINPVTVIGPEVPA